MNKKINKKNGFTLIEILVVIGIIAILAAIVIIAINPARQFAQARNTQRTANINAILNAVGQRIADNKGIFEGTVVAGSDCDILPETDTPITKNNGTLALGNKSADLGCLTPTYIPALPTDPAGVIDPNIGYNISVNSIGRVTVCAPKMLTEPSLTNMTPSDACVTR